MRANAKRKAKYGINHDSDYDCTFLDLCCAIFIPFYCDTA